MDTTHTSFLEVVGLALVAVVQLLTFVITQRLAARRISGVHAKIQAQKDELVRAISARPPPLPPEAPTDPISARPPPLPPEAPTDPSITRPRLPPASRRPER